MTFCYTHDIDIVNIASMIMKLEALLGFIVQIYGFYNITQAYVS